MIGLNPNLIIKNKKSSQSLNTYLLYKIRKIQLKINF